MSVPDPFHKGRTVTRRQLRILQARHDKRVKAQTAQTDAAQNDPAQVTAPLTPKTLAAEVQARTQAQYGPQVSQSQAQQQNISDWYANYQKTLADLQARQQQDYGAQTQNVQNAAASSSALDTQERQREDQAAAQDAAVRGATVNPAVSATAGQASLARNALINSFGAQLANQGLIQRDYMRGLEAGGVQQGVEAHQHEAKNLQNILGQEGTFAAKTAGDLRESERKYQLEQAAFGLNEAKAQNTADAAAARTAASEDSSKRSARSQNKRLKEQAKESKQRSSTTKASQQETARHNRATESTAQQRADKTGSGGGKSASSLTPTQARGYRQKYDQAQALVRAHGDKISRQNSQQAVDELVAKGVPRVLASIAVRQALGMPVGPTLTKQARRLGVKVPQSHVPKASSVQAQVGQTVKAAGESVGAI